jgi:dienelactone hydrolase
MGRMVDAQPLQGAKHETNEVTGNLHYLLSLPQGHDKAKKWPVIVFMHGIGEVDPEGDNLNALTKHSLPRLVEDPMFDYPFIVISPQIPSDGWVNHAAEISAALDRIEQEFGGDPKREYLTGLSYGGVGTLSVGIALADRIAALMPVTPGGTVSNWDMRSKIGNKPIWFFNGLKDTEYNTNVTRSMDLEAGGGEPFYRYTYAFADEYHDVVPKDVLAKKRVFGSYENIGHDVWHAAYGVYCPTLDSQKTVQYDWLLSQSLDGSPFVDPRDPNANMGMSGSGAGGAAGAGGGGGGNPNVVNVSGSGGSANIGGGGSPSMTGNAGSAGSAMDPVGSGGSAAGAPPNNASTSDSAGCSLAAGHDARGLAHGAGWLGLIGLAALARKNRRRARANSVAAR